MTPNNYYTVEKDDPDWQFTPEVFLDKKYRVVESRSIELGDGGKDTVVLRQSPVGSERLANHIHIDALDNSTLGVIIMNESDPNVQQVYIYDIHVKKNASIDIGLFARNGNLNKHIIQAIVDDGGHLRVSGLAMNTSGGDTEIISKVVHHGASVSDQCVYTMAGDESQTVFQGMTLLGEGSDCSKSVVQNSNLILTDGSRCFGKPEAFVGADGVSVAQQTTTNFLDADAVQYLMSRGFSESESIKIILDGFKRTVLSAISDESLSLELRGMFEID